MPVYNYLPGVIVNTLDGGLVAPAAPKDDSILILATAGQGPINTPVAVQDRTTNFNTFGGKGTLSRSVEECATYSDNITVLRIGVTAAQLQNVGKDTPKAAPLWASRSPSTADVWATATMTRSFPSKVEDSFPAREREDLAEHCFQAPGRGQISLRCRSNCWHRKPHQGAGNSLSPGSIATSMRIPHSKHRNRPYSISHGEHRIQGVTDQSRPPLPGINFMLHARGSEHRFS